MPRYSIGGGCSITCCCVTSFVQQSMQARSSMFGRLVVHCVVWHAAALSQGRNESCNASYMLMSTRWLCRAHAACGLQSIEGTYSLSQSDSAGCETSSDQLEPNCIHCVVAMDYKPKAQTAQTGQSWAQLLAQCLTLLCIL